MTGADDSVVPEAPRRRIVFAPSLRAMRILWRVLPWLAVAALLVLGGWIFGAPPEAVAQLLAVAGGLLAYGLLTALATEVLSPTRPALRLVPVSDARARRLTGTIRGLLFFLLLTGVGIGLVEANHWHPGVADVLRVVRNVVLVMAGAAILYALGFVRLLKDAKGETAVSSIRRFLGRVVAPLAVVTLLFVVVARGLGYLPLSAWFAENMGWTVLRLFVAVVIYRNLRNALFRTVQFYRAEGDGSTAGTETAGISEADTVALGIQRIGSGVLRLVVFGLAFFWVLAGWSLGPSVIFSALDTPITGDEGTTWGQMIHGILNVFLVIGLGWFLKNVLTYFVFPRSKVGVGARYAILAVLRYLTVGLAFVFSLGALGVDTSSLGWFFGAAGIGIGLGLQDIIGNFISGLIMLIERPIRVDDIVTVGDTTGKVENIRMRGTVLRTFDNTTVLIPNNQMLGERVTNLTHSMSNIRVMFPVGVSYGADPKRVREILLEIVKAHPKVLATPEPNVLFSGFGESSIDFNVVAFTHELTSRFGIASELRFEIFKRLGEEGIEIPFPQRDVHIRTGGLPPA